MNANLKLLDVVVTQRDLIGQERGGGGGGG